MKKISVTLDNDEVAALRQYSAELRENRARHGYRDKFQGGRDMADKELLGRLGEYAVAAWLGVDYDWSLFDNHRDVAGYEVRTGAKHWYGLATYKWDRPAIYLLTTCEDMRTVIIHGWEHLNNTRHADRWRDDLPYPAYMTPQNLLRPLDTLPR